MNVCNNSHVSFQVKISTDGLGTIAHTIGAQSRLKLSDYFPDNIIRNNPQIKYNVEVLYEGNTLHRYSHVPSEVYISLLDPKSGTQVPRTIVYLEGNALKRQFKKIDRLIPALVSGSVPYQDEHVRLVGAKMKKHNYNLDVHNLFSILYCYHGCSLLKKMTLPQMWAAVKLLYGEDEDLAMSELMQNELASLMKSSILKPDVS